MRKSIYLERAVKLADWFVKNQVMDPLSANCGRFQDLVRVKGQPKPEFLTKNWTTGMSIISLVMMYRRTRDKRYLESARMAGDYLKSLQFLDERNPKAFGLFREATPQTDYGNPRDALSSAWGLLHLYRVTRDADALWRVKVFAEWFRKHGVRKGYPAWCAYTDKGREPFWRLGSFHGGSPLFFFDLYKETGERKWLALGLSICDAWMRIFPKPDGSIRIEVDRATGKDLTGKGPTLVHNNWQTMHKTNDDFTTLALLRAYKLSGRVKYLAAARRFLDWALTRQRPDGAFGKVPVKSAAPVLILELRSFNRISREPRYKSAMERSIPFFLTLQELKSKEGRFHGGFYCTSDNHVEKGLVDLGVRTSCYALAALLWLEGKRNYDGYRA